MSHPDPRLPDFTTLREGGPDCPSDFTLDRLVSGELTAERVADTESHCASCDDCRARVATRRQGWAGIEGVDERVLLSRIRTDVAAEKAGNPLAVWFRRFFTVFVPVAAMGAAVLFVMPRGADEVDPGPVNRTKGGVALHVHRLTPAGTEELEGGARLSPGDRLRFSIDLPAPGVVRLFGVGANGVSYEVFPGASDSPERPAGQAQVLPGAVEVDASPGDERLFLVACANREATDACGYDVANDRVSCPPTCSSTRFLLAKGR